MKICYNCFSEMDDSAQHCENCGYRLDKKNESDYPQSLPCGSILHGEFIVGRVLGRGGFGITYLAQDYKTKDLVAIKEYYPGYMSTRSGSVSVKVMGADREHDFTVMKNAFLKEAITLFNFNGNPNIVKVHSYFEENGTAYYVMEYVDGESVKSYLKNRGGRLIWGEALNLLMPIVDALESIHKIGLIHRDISPDNIVMSKTGTVKLLDFGAARYSMGQQSESLSVILKHGFAPIEQYARRSRQGPWTDIYALGATFYNAITGEMVPDSIDRITEDKLRLPSSMGIDIPPYIEAALVKALAVQPENRFQTMAEFKEALLNPAVMGQTDPAGVGSRETQEKTGPAGNVGKGAGPAGFGFRKAQGRTSPAGDVGKGAGPAGFESRGPQEQTGPAGFESRGPQEQTGPAGFESRGPQEQTGPAGNAGQSTGPAGFSSNDVRGQTVPAGNNGQNTGGGTLPKRKIPLPAIIAAAAILVVIIYMAARGLPDSGSESSNKTGTSNIQEDKTDGQKTPSDNQDDNNDSKSTDGTDIGNIGPLFNNTPTEKDAMAYVKAVLDIICTGTYDSSTIKLSDVDIDSSEDMQSSVIDIVIASFETDYNLNDESKAVIKNTLVKAFSKCSYEVTGAEKAGDQAYDVTTSIRPLRLYDGVQDKVTEYVSNMDEDELSALSQDDLTNLILQKTFAYAAENLDSPTYDPAEDVVVTYCIIDEEKNMYGITEEDGQKLGMKLFSSNSGSSSTNSGTGHAVSGTETVDSESYMRCGNFYQKAHFAYNGKDCYYSTGTSLYKSAGQALQNSSLLVKSLVGDAFLNLTEDYIYFPVSYKSAIFRCDLNGENEIMVYDGSGDPEYKPQNLYMYGSWAYFSYDHKLYRVSIEELNDIASGPVTKPELIVDDFNFHSDIFPSLCITGGKIYYNGKDGLIRTDLDGSNPEKISSQDGALESDGTSIFICHAGSKVYRVDPDGTEELILELDIFKQGMIQACSWHRGSIYYVVKTDDSHELWKMSREGTGNVQLDTVCDAGTTMVSMCTFPDSAYAYFYLLEPTNPGFNSISKCISIDD